MKDPGDMKLLKELQEQMREEFAPSNLGLMPRIFRLVSIDHEKEGEQQTRGTATIFHEKAALRVCWVTGAPDPGLRPGVLVSPRWFGASSYEHGAIRISCLAPMERPESLVNLFHTVPYGWVKDRELIQQAAGLMEALPLPHRHLFNALFWDGQRFRRFCTMPARLEACLLSDMDRLSGTENLMQRCASGRKGWGAFHPHLKGSPYQIRSLNQNGS